jgi:Lipocalin-like domain
MKRRSILGLCASAMAALGLTLVAGYAVAQSAKDIIGTWTIVSAEAFGPSPKGILIFDGNGRFSLQLMKPDLPKYAANNRAQGTAEEYKATGQGILSFFGTYSVSGPDLIFHVEGSSYPNWTGTDQKRTSLTLSGDELKWTNPAPSAGGPPGVVVWKRVK